MRCDGYCVGEFFCLGIATLKTGFMDRSNSAHRTRQSRFKPCARPLISLGIYATHNSQMDGAHHQALLGQRHARFDQAKHDLFQEIAFAVFKTPSRHRDIRAYT